jgi:hypothetical protein
MIFFKRFFGLPNWNAVLAPAFVLVQVFSFPNIDPDQMNTGMHLVLCHKLCLVGMSGLREGEGAARAAGLQAGVRPHRPRHVAGRESTQQLGRIPQAW